MWVVSTPRVTASIAVRATGHARGTRFAATASAPTSGPPMLPTAAHVDNGAAGRAPPATTEFATTTAPDCHVLLGILDLLQTSSPTNDLPLFPIMHAYFFVLEGLLFLCRQSGTITATPVKCVYEF